MKLVVHVSLDMCENSNIDVKCLFFSFVVFGFFVQSVPKVCFLKRARPSSLLLVKKNQELDVGQL